MSSSPEIDDFRQRVEALRSHSLFRGLIRKGEVDFSKLSQQTIASLLKDDTAYYFLIAAAGLNRTSLKKETAGEEARIVSASERKAFVVQRRLPLRRAFAEVASSAVSLRRADLDRKSRGGIEKLFRDRLRDEGVPLLMSPPVRQVPGILIGKRKPDGVFPDPATNAPPRLYLEIKNVRRVSDDIQKRLYEIAEAALEMKFLYGRLQLRGLELKSTSEVLLKPSPFRKLLRSKILKARPVVVVLMLCARSEAERYREGAEAFVDRLFFQEEIDECIDFIKLVLSDSA